MSRRPEPEPVATIDDTAATQHRQVTEALQAASDGRLTVQAQAAGMPLASARRWPLYLRDCERRGKAPISLEQAVQQCRDARKPKRANGGRIEGQHRLVVLDGCTIRPLRT